MIESESIERYIGVLKNQVEDLMEASASAKLRVSPRLVVNGDNLLIYHNRVLLVRLLDLLVSIDTDFLNLNLDLEWRFNKPSSVNPFQIARSNRYVALTEVSFYIHSTDERSFIIDKEYFEINMLKCEELISSIENRFEGIKELEGMRGIMILIGMIKEEIKSSESNYKYTSNENIKKNKINLCS